MNSFQQNPATNFMFQSVATEYYQNFVVVEL